MIMNELQLYGITQRNFPNIILSKRKSTQWSTCSIIAFIQSVKPSRLYITCLYTEIKILKKTKRNIKKSEIDQEEKLKIFKKY